MEAPLLLPVSTASSSVDIDDDITAVDAVSAPPAAPSSPSTQSIVFRFVAVIAVVCASLFAQHEAAKGFGINVVSASAASTRRGSVDSRRFDLFFVSNGRAERILQYASRGVERALFPDASFPRKQVRRVTVKMAGHNLTADATVDATAAPGEYVISLSPALVSRTDHAAADAVAAAVRRAVARMWLWDGRGAAPAHVTEAMVEYLASVAAGDAAADAAATPLSSSVDDGDHRCISARFLRHLERQRDGFVARLNRAMRDRWSDAAVDAALGAPARHACAAYRAATSLTGQDPAVTTLAASTSDAARGFNVAT